METSCRHVATEEYWIDQKNKIIGVRCRVCGENLDHSPLEDHQAAEKVRREREVAEKRTKVRTNKRGQQCWICEGWVKPGDGKLFYVEEEMEGNYRFQSGWLVEHLDGRCCEEVAEEREAEERANAKRAAEIQRDAKDLAVRVAAETGLSEKFDWSWDDYSFSMGKELAESQYHVAREYFDCKTLIGFVIKKK